MSLRLTARLAAGVLTGWLALVASAQAQRLDKLVRISADDPFARCTADRVGNQFGTLFPNTEVEATVAVNSAMPGQLLTSVLQDRWDIGSRGVRAGLSRDGGKTWTTNLPPGVTLCAGGRYFRAKNTSTAFSLDGTAFFASLAFDYLLISGQGPNAVLLNRSKDGGLTWANPMALIADTDPGAFNEKQWITADQVVRGFVFASWDRFYDYSGPTGAADLTSAAHPQDGVDPAHVRIAALRAAAANGQAPATLTADPTYFTRSTDDGNTWQRAAPIYDPGLNAGTYNNTVAGTLPNGDLLNFFTHFDARGQTTIDVLRSPNQGFSWARKPLVIAPLGQPPVVTPGTKQPVSSADIVFSVFYQPGTYYIAMTWQDVPKGGSTVGVLFSASYDGGLTWSPPVQINQTPPNPANPLRQQAFNPTVTEDYVGNVIVTYYDFRNDTGTNGQELVDYWAVICSVHCIDAANWGREQRLTPTSFDILQAPLTRFGYTLGDYFGLTAQGTDIWPVFPVVTGPHHTGLFTRPLHLGLTSAAIHAAMAGTPVGPQHRLPPAE